MKKLFIPLLIVLGLLNIWAVQPPINGQIYMQWEHVDTNYTTFDYVIWETTNAWATQRQIGETRSNWFFTTNTRLTTNTYYGITAIPWVPFGVRRESDIKLLHWAFSGTNLVVKSNNFSALISATIPTNTVVQWSRDLQTFNNYFTISIVSNAAIFKLAETPKTNDYFFLRFPTLTNITN